MLFSRRHERELAEIRGLADALHQRSGQSLDDVNRIARGLGLPPAITPDGESPLIAFVHIPKTAGGTVAAMFVVAYSHGGLRKAGNYIRGPENAERKVAKPSWEKWRRKGGRVSAGHMPYAIFREHLPPDTFYMTFLREPVDRVVSHYHRHIARRDPRRAGQPSKSGRVIAESLEQALVDMELPQLSNLQTRFLCDDPGREGPLPATALAEAKRNLSTFGFVGIQEHFEESMARLQRALALEEIPSDAYESRHVSADRPTVDEIAEGDRELIAERNQLDAELYAFATRLFERMPWITGQGTPRREAATA